MTYYFMKMKHMKSKRRINKYKKKIYKPEISLKMFYKLTQMMKIQS